MDKRQILIHQAVARRAHSEYIIAKNSVNSSLLIIAMSIGFGVLAPEAGITLFAIGVIANFFTAASFHKAERKMKAAEKELLALQTEGIQDLKI